MIAKNGVDLTTLSAKGWTIAHVADRVHQELAGREVVVTSTTEGEHSVKRSAHYRGDAADLRIWHVDDAQEFADRLTEELGEDYFVLLEFRTNGEGQRVASHVHAHWGPIYHG